MKSLLKEANKIGKLFFNSPFKSKPKPKDGFEGYTSEQMEVIRKNVGNKNNAGKNSGNPGGKPRPKRPVHKGLIR